MDTRKELTSYFPHDSNARNSDKLTLLRDKYKATGYGIFLMILERLREEPHHTSIKDYDILAFDFHEDPTLIKSVIEDFDLFKFTDDNKRFYSDILNKWMEFSRKRMHEINIKEWHRIAHLVFERDSYTCQYCGKIGGILEIDHIIPFSKGGPDDMSNLITSCRRCNRQKKDKTVEEFIKWRIEHGYSNNGT